MTVSGNEPNKFCVFPFNFGGETFNACTMKSAHKLENKPWCSTKVDASGNHVKGNWGSCATNCPKSGISTSINGDFLSVMVRVLFQKTQLILSFVKSNL